MKLKKRSHIAAKILRSGRNAVLFLNTSLATLCVRLSCALALLALLTLTLCSVSTRIQPTHFDRWDVVGLYWYGWQKRPYTALAMLHSLVAALLSSVLATVGYCSTDRFAWTLMVPWLAKTTVYWSVSVLASARTYAQVSQVQYTGQMFAIMICVSVVQLLVLGQMVQLWWHRFQRAQTVTREAESFQCWRRELSLRLPSKAYFNVRM